MIFIIKKSYAAGLSQKQLETHNIAEIITDISTHYRKPPLSVRDGYIHTVGAPFGKLGLHNHFCKEIGRFACLVKQGFNVRRRWNCSVLFELGSDFFSGLREHGNVACKWFLASSEKSSISCDYLLSHRLCFKQK